MEDIREMLFSQNAENKWLQSPQHRPIHLSHVYTKGSRKCVEERLEWFSGPEVLNTYWSIISPREERANSTINSHQYDFLNKYNNDTIIVNVPAILVGTRESSYGPINRIKDTGSQCSPREGETAPWSNKSSHRFTNTKWLSTDTCKYK